MSGSAVLEEVEVPLEANGQAAWFIDDTFTTTDTSDFAGSVRCSAIAVQIGAAGSIFTTLPVVEVNRDRAEATTLDFTHFANSTWVTARVFVNLETEPSGPAIYFYDTELPVVPVLPRLPGDGVKRTRLGRSCASR